MIGSHCGMDGVIDARRLGLSWSDGCRVFGRRSGTTCLSPTKRDEDQTKKRQTE
jgi:hypothetical protein